MTSTISRSAALSLVTCVAGMLAACGGSTSGVGGEGGSAASTKSSSSVASSTKSASVSATSSDVSASSSATGVVGPCDDENLPEEDLGTGPDPEAGMFTLDEALAGLPEGPGPLRAILTTDLGVVTCNLLPEVAPNGVANFVGLARGRRPFKAAGKWIRGRRFYDGLIFHRVIDDFMAQGGDPLGTGFGGPGYKFADEIGAETHSPGTLAYANSGANTNGSQFYIVAETGADFLDGEYTIFGRCTPVDTVKAMTEVETDPDDKPLVDVHLQTVAITRCAE